MPSQIIIYHSTGLWPMVSLLIWWLCDINAPFNDVLSNKAHKIFYVIWLWTTNLCSYSYLWNLILWCNLHKNNNLFIFHLYPFSLYQVQYCYAMVRSVWLILAGYAKALDINIKVNVWILPGGQELAQYSEYNHSLIFKLRKTLIRVRKKIELCVMYQINV